MLDKECLFCKIINNEIPSRKIYEDNMTYAFLDIAPNSDGHALVIPKAHFIDLESCSNDYLSAVALTKKKVANILRNKLKPQGINYVSNQGAMAYQVVFHYHEHVIPKYAKDEGYVLSKKVDVEHQTSEHIDMIYKKIMD